jgi:hypothetical protein
LERKIIVGGENLLEKAEQQAKLLEQSEKQLEKQKEKREAMRQKLEEKEVTYTFFSWHLSVSLFLNVVTVFLTGGKDTIGRKICQSQRRGTK